MEPENSMTTQNVFNFLKSIAHISDQQIEQLFAISHLKNIQKGHCFIRAGETSGNFAFVIRGLFRYYYLDEAGNEFTKGFFLENSVISSYSALIQNRESYFSIEALEDSQIMVVNYQAWKQIAENELGWKNFLISLLEKGYCIKESREREFLLFDAEARYQSFLRTFPGLEKRIKQHFIASYLGITPVALSRVRKKMGFINLG